MSGQSKRNPMAVDYNGSGKPPPKIIVSAELVAMLEPSKEWMRENAVAVAVAVKEGTPPPDCPAESCEVVFRIAGQMLLPNPLAQSPKDWPFGDAPVAEIHRMPWTLFRDLIVQEHPGIAEAANKVLDGIVRN